MCGRFTQHYTWHDLEALFDLAGPPRNLQPRYNIAPTDTVDAVVAGDGARTLVPMRWGLVPWWWKKSLRELPATFNARAETIAQKPMFRDAFARRRCIIPASGYYEWLKTPSGRDPYYISAAADGVLSFAGLWDTWTDPRTGVATHSCTVVVTAANALTRGVHDRMPVVLEAADVAAWFGAADASLLRPAAEGRLRMWRVSRRVNRVGAGGDDPTLVQEAAGEAPAGAPPLL